jgi:hypothetical protein
LRPLSWAKLAEEARKGKTRRRRSFFIINSSGGRGIKLTEIKKCGAVRLPACAVETQIRFSGLR